jgi:hypothetical protein
MKRVVQAAGLLVVLLCLLAGARPAAAAVFTVDRTDDVIATGCLDAVPDDCSLRGAVIRANASLGGDTIVVPAGTYVLTRLGSNEDEADTGDLDVTNPLTITGAGAASTVIDGNGTGTPDPSDDRVLHIQGSCIRSVE